METKGKSSSPVKEGQSENYESITEDSTQTPPSSHAGAPSSTGMSVAFSNLNVHGFGRQTDYQKTFANFPLSHVAHALNTLTRRAPETRVEILRGIDGVVKSGELLLVLGKPGSGCTTLLKTLAGHTRGLHVDDQSTINYQGVPSKTMHNRRRGEITYQDELDVHFPTLKLRETLEFAARARASSKQQTGDHASQTANSVAAGLGLSKALETPMGNAFVPGVSGGERKRTSIAEIIVGDSVFQCWDNSTRGLDSASALEFVRMLRGIATERQCAAVVTLYQAGEEIYNLFEKVLVLYEGRQVYFGPTQDAKAYFTSLGFVCSARSTTPDFLTSVTRPGARAVREGFEGAAPRTADDFSSAWRRSTHRGALARDVHEYNALYARAGGGVRRPRRGKERAGWESPYALPGPAQVSLCVWRGLRRVRNALNAPISALVGNAVTSLILGSMFYGMGEETESFYGRSVLLFFTVLLNTSAAAFECVELWGVRPIVEKQARYAFYRPSAEAISALACSLPTKLLQTLVFNLPLYYLANLRRSANAFFTFYLFAFVAFLNGSMIYRTMGAMSRTSEGSQPLGAVFSLLLTLYCGFVVPFPDMRPWLRWFAYVNPVYYALESMSVNEFAGRRFACSRFVPEGPEYADLESMERACAAVGAERGQDFVTGDAYILSSYGFESQHLWRNLGVMLALMAFYGAVYVVCSEYISMQPSRGEILLFRKGKMPVHKPSYDEEAQSSCEKPDKGSADERPVADADLSNGADSAATFVWNNLSYDIKVGKAEKRILDDVEGWIKPHTMTALMGASGAGKTTLLNVLAERVTTGIIGGEKLVDARHRDLAFARKIGYAQQEDLHQTTATVREALEFSALLRQPPRFSDAEKLAHVERVLDLLEISRDGFADAVVGVPGVGLNVEQRKRVTIAVELAARPELLLFLDEPTSGLDSDSSMAICRLLRRLADSGQAILCTVHQPSSVLLENFDRLLVLAEGRELYFGELGPNFGALVGYFEGNGARKCGAHENPAEWMLEVSRTPPEAGGAESWADVWKSSAERAVVKEECERMKSELAEAVGGADTTSRPVSEFATPLLHQFLVVTRRAFQHDWRSPTYLWSKLFTTFGVAFVNGVSFWDSGSTPQDLQNQIFSLFILTTLFGAHVQLIMARFQESRLLYESRERRARAYAWPVFLASNVLAEFCSQTAVAGVAFAAWYYPLGLWRDALELGQLHERGGLTFLLVWSLMVLFQTLSQMVMVVAPDVPTGINIGQLLFVLSLLFSGVLVAPSALPRFWTFMPRATPLSYFISATMSSGVSGQAVRCAAKDLVIVPSPPPNQTCDSYLAPHVAAAGGALLNPGASADCSFCPYDGADAVLARFGMRFADRWRNWGVTVAYNVANVGLAALLYWLTKASRGAKTRRGKEN